MLRGLARAQKNQALQLAGSINKVRCKPLEAIPKILYHDGNAQAEIRPSFQITKLSKFCRPTKISAHAVSILSKPVAVERGGKQGSKGGQGREGVWGGVWVDLSAIPSWG